MRSAAELGDLAARLRRPGVWCFTDTLGGQASIDLAVGIEAAGYSALWLPEAFGRDPFAQLAAMAEHTSSLILATGIANVYHRLPGPMLQAAMTLEERARERFVLGLGVSHRPLMAGQRKIPYDKPLAYLRTYLETMYGSFYRVSDAPAAPPVLIGALGAKMLELSGELADGAHPYWTTPAHTAEARSVLGPDKLLCVEQKVVLETDPAVAREIANVSISVYAQLPNYRNSWRRQGFSEDEIERRDPRFVDGVVCWGDEEAIAARVTEHYDAGASHVCIQPLTAENGRGVDVEALWRLAPALTTLQPAV